SHLPSAWAGGPIAVSFAGKRVAWPAGQPIAYRIDPGMLGRWRHDRPAQWVREAFQQWQSVEHARLAFVDQGALGIGGPPVTTDLLLQGRIRAGWSIIHGRGLAGYRPEFVRNTIWHEMGHPLGLDHSQINATRLQRLPLDVGV